MSIQPAKAKIESHTLFFHLSTLRSLFYAEEIDQDQGRAKDMVTEQKYWRFRLETGNLNVLE